MACRKGGFLAGVALGAACLILTPSRLEAAQGGPDAFGYRWLDQDEPGVDPSIPAAIGPAISVVIGNEQVSPAVDLGFSFPFYGGSYSQFVISDNGWLSFDTSVTSPSPTNTTLPSNAQPNRLLAYFWRDLAAPEYIFVEPIDGGTQIVLLTRVPGAPAANIQVWINLFYTGIIKINYTALDQPSTASIGIEDAAGTVGLNPWYRGTGVNGYQLESGTTLVYLPPSVLECAAPTPIGCQILSSSSPKTLVRNVSNYSCSPTSYLGREQVFRFDNPSLADVTFSLGNVTPGVALDILVIRAGTCSEFECLAGGPSPVVVPFLAKGSYYVVVDGRAATDNGNFDLNISCQPKSAVLNCQSPGAPPINGRTSGVTQWGQLGKTYPCTNLLLDGPEFIYEIPFNQSGNIKAVLSHDPKVQLDLIAFGPDQFNPPTGCRAWGDQSLTLYNPPRGTYYFVVDGRGDPSDPTIQNAGDFTLSITCDVLLDCSVPRGDLTCFDEISGTTVGATSRAEQYSCSTELFTGPEVVYRFHNDARRTMSFIYEGPPDLSLFLIGGGCNEGGCVQYGNGRLVARDLPVGDYYLVVDGRNGASGSFKITPVCSNKVSPDRASVVLKPGETFHETKTTWVNADITRGDVVFAVDTTGSMIRWLPAIKNSANSIIAALSQVVDDVQFGVTSFEDYPATYSSCGYSAAYGGGADRPYRLNLAVTNNLPALNAAILGLPPGNGGDLPESYVRVWYEMYADATSIGWRPGARRIAVMFGDDQPHVCANQSGGCSTSTTGVDPGRDGFAGTADDLLLPAVMVELKRQGTVPVYNDVRGNFTALWSCYTGMASGRAYDAPQGVVDPVVVDQLRILIEEKSLHCDVLEAKASAGFGGWILNIVPTSIRTDLPAKVNFDFDISPPAATPAGIYNFTVDMVCDGVIKASQDVTVEVPGSCVPNPQVARSGSTCSGSLQSFDASASTIGGCPGQVHYQWKDSNDVLIDPPGPFSSANAILGQRPVMPTTYKLEIRCSDQAACPAIGVRTVPVNVDLAPRADAGADLTVCLNETATLGTPGTAGLTYEWTPQTELSNPFIDRPDFQTAGPVGLRSYTVKVTETASGCSATSTVNVDVISGAPVGSIGNALRATKRVVDVDLSWVTGPLNPRTYNVHRELQKTDLVLPLPGAPAGQASNVEGYIDPGAVSDPRSVIFFYQAYGRDCAGKSVFQ